MFLIVVTSCTVNISTLRNLVMKSYFDSVAVTRLSMSSCVHFSASSAHLQMAVRALIQGSSRGIGLEYCRMILLRSQDVKVIATCRSPDNATELQKLSSEMSGRLAILPLDVTKEKDIQVYNLVYTFFYIYKSNNVCM